MVSRAAVAGGTLITLALATPASAQTCPDHTATGRVRVQFPGPCDPARPFVSPIVDVGIALQTLAQAGEAGVPYLVRPGECVWLERRWLPCLRSRCVGATADVEPGDITRPRGLAPLTGATCSTTWGSP